MPANPNAVWDLLRQNQPTVAAAVAASDRRAIATLAVELGAPFAGDRRHREVIPPLT